MVPPGVASPDLARRTFVAHIPPGTRHCAIESAAVQLQLRNERLHVTVTRDALLAQPPGWLSDWGVRAEAQGCVATGQGQELAERIVESLPLDPAAAFRLLHPSTVASGYVDLGPETRLQVFSPILRDGATTQTPAVETAQVSGAGAQLDVQLKMSPNVIGFETAWYALEPNPGRPGCHIVPLSADRSIQGAVEHLPAPATNYFQLPPDAAFFRLLYKSDANGVTAIVAFAATRGELGLRAQAAANPAACEKLQAGCRALPRNVGVNPFLVVKVNGAEVVVPVGARLSAAIQAAGVKNPGTLLPGLRVMRPFGGKPTPIVFDPQSRDILDLPLTGTEQISWPAKPAIL